MTYVKKLTAVKQDPTSTTKKPGMIYSYSIEADGLGGFDVDVAVPGTTAALKDPKKKAEKVDALVSAAVADSLAALKAQHAG